RWMASTIGVLRPETSGDQRTVRLFWRRVDARASTNAQMTAPIQEATAMVTLAARAPVCAASTPDPMTRTANALIDRRLSLTAISDRSPAVITIAVYRPA